MVSDQLLTGRISLFWQKNKWTKRRHQPPVSDLERCVCLRIPFLLYSHWVDGAFTSYTQPWIQVQSDSTTAHRNIVTSACVHQAAAWDERPIEGLSPLICALCVNTSSCALSRFSFRRLKKHGAVMRWGGREALTRRRRDVWSKCSQRLGGTLKLERHSFRRSAPQSEGGNDWEKRERRRGFSWVKS